MNPPSVIEANEALMGALARADRLPDWNASSLEPSAEVWEDGDIWTCEWEKWEKWD
jgi:hypothetical protein